MNIWKNFILLNEEGDLYDTDDSGGGADTATDLYDGVDGTDGATSPDGADDSGSPDDAHAAPAMSAADITKAVMAGIAPVMQRQAAPQQRQMTDEEFQKHTAYRKLDDKFVERLFGPSDDPKLSAARLEALQEMYDAASTHAIRVAQMFNQHSVGELRQSFNPLIEAQRKQQDQAFVGKVLSYSPSFKGMSNIAQVAIQQLQQQGYTETDESKAIAAVAKTMKALILQANPNFRLVKPSGAGRAGMPRMAGSVNGGSGQRGGTGGKPQKKAWDSLYS